MDPLVVAGRLGKFVDDRLIDGEPVADADFLADILREIRRPLEFDHSPSFLMMPIMYPIFGRIGKTFAGQDTVLPPDRNCHPLRAVSLAIFTISEGFGDDDESKNQSNSHGRPQIDWFPGGEPE